MSNKDAILNAPIVQMVSSRVSSFFLLPKQNVTKARRAKRKSKYSAAVYSPHYGGFVVNKFAIKMFCRIFEGDYPDISREDPMLVDLT